MTTTSPAEPTRLGAHLTGEGVQFALWAPRAERVELVLVDEQSAQTNLDMEPDPTREGGWRLHVPGIGDHQTYGYRVHGPWDPASGQRFNPARLLLDPYARAITGGIDYRGPIHDHVSDDYLVPDTTDSFGSVPLSVVVADSPPPTPLEHRRPISETVIYEMHVRGFTKLHPLVPEHLRGTFGGLAYPDVIAYLKDLGVTAVELLPVHHFVSEPFVAAKGLRNYWGYNTLGFFAPHAYYATLGSLGHQVTEFKQMVSALHEAGLEVLLDVVYNHTGEGGHEGPTLSMRGIDHGQYYRLTSDMRDDYDVTGCGNSVNTAHPQVLQLVIDSLRYWVTEMGVDGFRFDLATTLIRDASHHVDHTHEFKQLLASDPTFRDIKMIAEPWDVGPYGYQVGAWGPGWYEWNDRFRDLSRDFWRGASHGVQELATRLSGSPDLFDDDGRPPAASVNYVTAHDGFTMRDVVSYDVKHNLANGESNRDGSDNNRSWNHGWEGDTDDPEINDLRARQVLNLHATQLLAAGTPMITAGDEFGRTQRGNNNAYCQDSPLSWVDWVIDERWQQVHDRVAALLQLRSDQPLLRPDAYHHHAEVLGVDDSSLERFDLTWMNGRGGEMTQEDWHDQDRTLLGMYVSDAFSAFLSWFHTGTEDITITLPDLPWAREWQVVWDSALGDEVTQQALPAGASFLLPRRSVVVMKGEVPATRTELDALA